MSLRAIINHQEKTNMLQIQANTLDYRALNEKIRSAREDCLITDCLGQRFIADGLQDHTVTIEGTPGNALGAYLDGAEITVRGNAQDAVGDTMNDGRIIICGNVGDAVGYAMRGGEIYIKGNAGYRAGVHMKAYETKQPILVIGGRVGSFAGEYQAGGTILVLGLHADGKPISGFFPCTGMHGGKMIFRGDVSGIVFPQQTTSHRLTAADMPELRPLITRFCALFGYRAEPLLADTYTVITPVSSNPYHQLYVAN